MIDYDILEKFGSTKERLRAFFSCAAGSNDKPNRERLERDIEARIHEGMTFNMRNYRTYTVSDLAWDTQPITPELIPLMLYAQKKINFKSVFQQLKDIDPNGIKKYAELDKDGNVKDFNLSKFHEVSVNLVRSLVTRRTASLSVDRAKLHPFLKFDPVSTSFVGKLRGDVLSQRIEMMTNQYGYRHDLPQTVRDMLMYSHCLEFPAGAWDVQKQVFKKKRAKGFDSSGDNNFDVETKIVREGVPFVRPHPTRVFWDNAHPLSSLNTDTGCDFVGFWTVVRYKDIEKNTDYFNRNDVAYSHTSVSLLNANRPFFELYFPTSPINFPSPDSGADVATNNDREQNVGRYSGTDGDKAITLVDYRIRIVPKEYGIGDYPFPVWLRLVVAGTRTVVFAEFLPSLPAVYFGYNEDDGRQVNPAWAHEIIPWQDQSSNLLTQMLFTMKSSMIKVLCANIDIMTPEMLADFRAIIKGERYTVGPSLLEVKGEQFEGLGFKLEDVFKIVEAQTVNDLSVYFRAMVQLFNLADRVLNVTQQELGQTASHELSATEVSAITNTMNTMSSYMGIALDEGLAAKKRITYESLVACGQEKITVPIVNRYEPDTIKAAGFEPVTEAEESEVSNNYQNKGRGLTIVGSKQQLVYDYTFTSRDGSERMSNAKSAEVLVNLLGQLINIPGLLQDMGKEKLYKFINHVVRMSGAGVDMIFDMSDGENETVLSGDPESDNKKEIQDVIRQILDAIQTDRAKIEQLAQAVGMPAAQQQPPSGDVPMPQAPSQPVPAPEAPQMPPIPA